MKNKVNFDEYSNEYNEIMEKQHSKFGEISYYSEYKVKILKNLFPNNKKLNILEYGCGIGRNLSYLEDTFKDSTIYGFDISDESLNIAKKENPNVKIITESIFHKYEKTFDLIFIAGVYHHISPSLRDEVTSKVKKLLKDDANLVIFEHNPYNPLTRHMVNTCEFDADAVLLSRRELIKLFENNNFKYVLSKYTLFIPPKLKKINFIEKYIYWLPLGGQYYVQLKNND